MNQVLDEERLGRGVFSSRQANRAMRSKAPYHVFLERRGVVEISVDRLNLAPPEKALEIANSNAVRRGATFYGWAAVKAKVAKERERQVRASPIPDNSFHADIILPDSVKEDRNEQIIHAIELARNSKWCDRSDTL